jgi:hypothetical protein
MSKWILAVLFALVLCGAGCQKKSLSDTNASQSPAVSQATPEQQREKTEQLGQTALGDDTAVSAKLKELAPTFGYSFSEENSSLVGPGTPPVGVKLPVLIGQVKAKLPADPAATTPDLIDQAVREVLSAMQSAAAASTQVPAGQQRPDPIIPKSVLGIWRTVREEQGETLTVQHDDKYYDQMSLDENNKMASTTIRDGKVFDQSEFNYRYDAKTGKLTLLADNGSPVGAMMITSYPDHPELIYVKEEGNDTVKVYENIGGPAAKAGKGGTPPASGGPSPTAPKEGTK